MTGLLDEFIDLDDLAREFKVSRRTVDRYVHNASPGLPIIKLGRRPIVRRSDVPLWLEARRVQRNAPRARR